MSEDTKKEMDSALSYDPLQHAEDITKSSYKEDAGTSALGFLLMQENMSKKNKMLSGSFDTTLSNDLDYYMDVVKDLGFEVVLKDKLPLSTVWDETTQEYLYVLWNSEKSILLEFDTTGSGEMVNGGNFYYNIRFSNNDTRYDVTSSGGYYNDNSGNHYGRGESENIADYVWCGDHDCREAIRRKIERLDEAGEFLTFWVHNPISSMLGYTEWKQDSYDYDYANDITAERISRLPDYVQEKITSIPTGE